MDTLRESPSEQLKNTYSHQEQKDKHYFGGFFNLAVLNIESALEEFALRNGKKLSTKKFTDKVNPFKDYFDPEKTSLVDWERNAKMLAEYFPFVNFLPITDHDLKEKEKRILFNEQLPILFKLVDSFRNYYTHYYHKPIQPDDKEYTLIDGLLLRAAKKVKHDKKKSDKTRQLLKEALRVEFSQLTEFKKDEIRTKEKEKRVKPGTFGSNDPIQITNAIINDAFNSILYKPKGSEFEELKHYYKSKPQDLENSDLLISQNGLIFLLSLFLNKRENELLKSRIKGYKLKMVKGDQIDMNNNSLKYMATHWVMTYLSFKGIKRKINTNLEVETLLVQMVDELSKVPHEVYEVLSESDQKQFLEDINEYMKDNEENDSNLEQSTVIHPVIRKRSGENKFNYFVLRFLDLFAEFDSLRFAVHVGNFIRDTRTKQLAGTQMISNRTIKEKIIVFEKLSEVSKIKEGKFHIDNESDSSIIGWEKYPNPSYLMLGNNIPIYLTLTKKEGRVSLLEDENSKESKESIAKRFFHPENPKHGKPTALLSANEFPALLYSFLCQNNSGKKIEGILKKKIAEHTRLIENFSGERVQTDILPRKFQESTDKEHFNINKFLKAIQYEIELTQKKRDLIRQNQKELDNKTRKYLFYTNELGKEAVWLANELKRFMPKFARINWKSYHHSNLQRYLALYGEFKDQIRELIESVWNLQQDKMIGSEIRGLFLENEFEGFYKGFLKIRLEILLGFEATLNQHWDNERILKKAKEDFYRIFRERLYRVKPTNIQREELLSKPICLPRGLFDEKPTFKKGFKIEESPDEFADWYKFAYSHRDSEVQSFYTLKRDYKEAFEKYKLNDEQALKNKKELSTEKMFELFKMKCDLKIKTIRTQDVFVKLMVEYIFNHLYHQKFSLPLRDYYISKLDRQIIKEAANEQSKRTEGAKESNIYDESFIWKKTIPLQLPDGIIIENEVKLKEVGKFRRFTEKNQRIQTLISYEDYSWSTKDLENELELSKDSYERIRSEYLLKEIQEFECYLLNQHKEEGVEHPSQFEEKKNPSFKMYLLHGVVKKKYIFTEEESEYFENLRESKLNEEELVDELKSKSQFLQLVVILLLIRNKYAHNQLPHKGVFQLCQELLFPKEERVTYSKYYLEITKEIIYKLKK